MGSRDPQKQLWSYHVNLDKRVRSDHPPSRPREYREKLSKESATSL